MIGLGVFAVALLTFAELTDDVSEGDSVQFDQAVLDMLRAPDNPAEPVGPAWLDIAIYDLTALGSIAVLSVLILLAAGYLLLARQPGKALMLGAALGGGIGLSEMLKGLFERARPPEPYWMADALNHSYPSGHALLATVVYLTLGVMLARAVSRRRARFYILSAAAMLALIVGLSRAYLGVHWTTDVLAGWSIGAAWASLLWLIARAFSATGIFRRGAKDGAAATTPSDDAG